MLTIKVTQAHIDQALSAQLLDCSPVRFALIELGFELPHVTQRTAYIGDLPYPLPDIAVQNEVAFDFISKGGKLQGEESGLIEYTFEMEIEL